MRILLTNDDGIDAPGLASLAEVLIRSGHELYICAPKGQRSAASHGITLTRSLTVQQRDFPGTAAAWAISGTPADCVRIALRSLVKNVDYVFSGINHGFNVGTDVLYSGTVAAAMEAALSGLPAMAVSLGKNREDLYGRAADLALKVLERSEGKKLSGFVLNLNVPETDELSGIRMAPLGMLNYQDGFRLISEDEEGCHYEPWGWLDESVKPEGDTDYVWLARGFATVTVLHYNMTDIFLTDALKEKLNGQY